jgi:adenylate kinase
MIYYVGGINGTGKSTVLAQLAQMNDFEIVPLTQRLIQFAGLTGYDELRQRSQVINRRDLAELINGLVVESENKNIVLDGHYLNLRRGRVSKVTGSWIGRMTALILITADPAVIYERINQDNKDRALFGSGLSGEAAIKRLAQYQLQTIAEFDTLADRYTLPKIVVENNDVYHAAAAIRLFHRSLVSGKGAI